VDGLVDGVFDEVVVGLGHSLPARAFPTAESHAGTSDESYCRTLLSHALPPFCWLGGGASAAPWTLGVDGLIDGALDEVVAGLGGRYEVVAPRLDPNHQCSSIPLG